MITERTSYVIYHIERGFVKTSSPLAFCPTFDKAKIYTKEGLAKYSITVHKSKLEGAVIMELKITLDPEKVFMQLLLAGK